MAFFRTKDKQPNPHAGSAARDRRREQLQIQQQMLAARKVDMAVADDVS